MSSIRPFSLANSECSVRSPGWGMQGTFASSSSFALSPLQQPCAHTRGSVSKGSYRKIPSQHKKPFRVSYCWPFPQQGNLGAAGRWRCRVWGWLLTLGLDPALCRCITHFRGQAGAAGLRAPGNTPGLKGWAGNHHTRWKVSPGGCQGTGAAIAFSIKH